MLSKAIVKRPNRKIKNEKWKNILLAIIPVPKESYYIAEYREIVSLYYAANQLGFEITTRKLGGGNYFVTRIK